MCNIISRNNLLDLLFYVIQGRIQWSADPAIAEYHF